MLMKLLQAGIDAVRTAWQTAPPPLSVIGLLGGSYVWLYVEFQTTTLARRVRGWQRPIPGMPLASELAAWLVKLCRWAIVAWLAIFCVLWVGRFVDGLSTGRTAVGRLAYQVGAYWLAARRVLDAPVPEGWSLVLAPSASVMDDWVQEELAAVPSPTPVATPGLTRTPRARSTPRRTPASVGEVEVKAPGLNLRAGPGVEYPILDVAKRGDHFELVGRTRDGRWVKVCCAKGAMVWLAGRLVETNVSQRDVPIVHDIPPTPRVTSTPTSGE